MSKQPTTTRHRRHKTPAELYEAIRHHFPTPDDMPALESVSQALAKSMWGTDRKATPADHELRAWLQYDQALALHATSPRASRQRLDAALHLMQKSS